MTNKELMDKAVESTMKTLSTLGISVLKGENMSSLDDEFVHVQIQFIGDTNGYFILEIGKEFGCKIANQLLAGMMTVTDIDDMCKSVLCEVCNMISGNIATVFSEAGLASDIKPPLIEVRKNPISSNMGTSLIGAEQQEEQLINTYFLIPRS